MRRAEIPSSLLVLVVLSFLGGAANASTPTDVRKAPAPSESSAPDSTFPLDLLIVAPHPDDEVLTTAGVVQRAIANGESVRIVYVTNGDYEGPDEGLLRQDEAVNGAAEIGVPEEDQIFLGYPDAYLRRIDLDYTGIGDQFFTPWSQGATYGDRGLGGKDYHTYRFGTPAPYNRPSILMDLEDIFTTLKPRHVFVTAEWDRHTDHSTTYSFVSTALAAVFLADPTYEPTVHKTIVWNDAPGQPHLWPEPLDPTTDHVEPPNLSQTDLLWEDRQSIDVPLSMQSPLLGSNPKSQAIAAHGSQSGTTGFLGRFLHRDEIFWVENQAGTNRPPKVDAGTGQTVPESTVVQLDGTGSADPDGTSLTYAWTQVEGIPVILSGSSSSSPTFVAPSGLSQNARLAFELAVGDGQFTSIPDMVVVTVIATNPDIPETNIAPLAAVSASSENPSDGQLAIKAVDGVVDGYPGDHTKEWATLGELEGAWIGLDWSRAYSVDRIVLYDRPNPYDRILSATLTFSDSTTVPVGWLADHAEGDEYTFAPKLITGVELTVTAVAGNTQNIGLAEFEVFRTPSPDMDGDDWTLADGDCDDTDAAIRPGLADSSCDGVDQNCSGTADEGYGSQATSCGVGPCGAAGSTSCVAGEVVDSCVPGTPVAEVCDGIDNDCNGAVDNGVLLTFYADGDSDGFGTDASSQEGCVAPGPGYVGVGGDCNDSDSAVHPGLADSTCDGIDQNCSGAADEEYASQATSCGVGACGAVGSTSCVARQIVDSCAPGTPTSEVCDGIDNDCNGAVDNGVLLTFYADGDSDGFGTDASSQEGCVAPGPGYVGVGGDCNDSDSAVHPGAADSTCDGIDQNCSGAADEEYASQATSCGVGACGAVGSTSCVARQIVDSCAPGTPTSEVCDGIDNDCNGAVDNGVLLTFYADGDSDGFGQDALNQQACTAPAGYATVGGDCDDASAAIHPGLTDSTCDGIDQNCSGAADEEYASQATSCGVGACGAVGSTSCVAGEVVDSCAPGTPTSEVCDGIDNDCNGTPDDAPVPIGTPALTVAGSGLSWTSVAGATAYDVVRGGLTSLRATDGDYTASTEECLADDLSGNALAEPSVPVAGQGSWFLVRAVSCGGAGSFDETTGSQQGLRDAEISASVATCP